MRRVLLILTLVLAPQLLGAQVLPFLYSPTDARSAALGGAGVALDADAWAMDNNLAAAALSNRHFALGVAYERWAPKLTADNRFSVDGWFRRNRWALGLSVKGVLAPENNGISATGAPLDPFHPTDLSTALGAAWSPGPGFALSASARFVSSALDADTRGMAVCGDIALSYASKSIQVGVSAHNLGGRIRYGDTDYVLPTLLKAGLSYTHPIFTLTAEADYLLQAGLMACVGAEVWPVSVLALRAGYHYGAADKGLPSFGSCGIGLNLKGFVLNAAYLFGSPALGNTFSVGMAYSF